MWFFAASRSVPYMAYISHVVTGVWCGEVGICYDRVCVLFVSIRSGIVFNSSASAITHHSQSAKDINPYFKSQLYAEYSGRWKTVRILPNSKPGERLHDRNFISAVGRIRTHNLLINSPAHYHWAITTVYLDIIIGLCFNGMPTYDRCICLRSLNNPIVRLPAWSIA